jgi:carboxypeptidase Q
MNVVWFVCLSLILHVLALSQSVTEKYAPVAKRLMQEGLRTCESYDMLVELTTTCGHRLSGSEGAAKAVALTKQMMTQRGFDNVHLEKIMAPRWVRGSVETATATVDGQTRELSVCALGGSIGTDARGIEAEVVEVMSFDDLQKLGDKAKGRIVFFNRPMDPSKLSTFEAYGGAVDQRSRGAVEAAKVGGLAALVRSMTLKPDDVPHTGAMNYVDSVQKIPSAALGIISADWLSGQLRQGKTVRVRLTLSCETLHDVESANVLGEITGSEKPDEIIVVGGHLDSWDKGTGAHDDGGGCMQAIEVVHLIKKLGLKPKRTIRAVMFMNEENGVRGGKAYPVAPERKGERHVAALESDGGAHAPRGIGVQADSVVLRKVLAWKPLFDTLLAGDITAGGSGVDVGPLVATGVPGFGLRVENHRYFDYHHSDNDTVDKVHPREIEMGAIVEALLCYLISEEGL